MIELTHVCPVKRSCIAVNGTATSSSWSRPKPDWPLDCSTPITWNGTDRMTTVWPTALPLGKRLLTTVCPSTATLLACRRSSEYSTRPPEIPQFSTMAQSGVVPVMPVAQLAPPATTCALVPDCGATAATDGIWRAIAAASPGVNDCRAPEPRLTPPLTMLPGTTTIRLLPKRASCACTAARAPLPIDIEVMTAATPMMMPSVVRIERNAFSTIACHATENSTPKFISRYYRRR